MYNDWFKIGSVTVHGYGVMIAVGILAAFWMAERLAKRFHLETNKIDNLIFLCVIVGFVGAKGLFILTDLKGFMANPIATLGSQGFVVYGGILSGALAGYLYCRHYHLDFLTYFHVLAPCIALAQGFGRIGCFLAGCCYGIPTDAWYGVTFPVGSLGPGAGIKVIPTELISSLGNFIIFGVLYYVLTKSKESNKTGAWYLILYGFGRFLVEFIRGDLIRGMVGFLSTSQFISLFVVAGGVGLLMLENKRKVVIG